MSERSESNASAGSAFRKGYPFQVWHSVSTWHPELGLKLHSHCATEQVAEDLARDLRRYKIMGSNGPTRRNYYGRVTIRRQNCG